MTRVHTYLNFPGNAEEAFEFYRSVFGGEFRSRVRFAEMPMEGVDIPEADKSKMMHIALPIGDDDVLMASDILPSMGQEIRRGNNVYISLHPDSREEATESSTPCPPAGRWRCRWPTRSGATTTAASPTSSVSSGW